MYKLELLKDGVLVAASFYDEPLDLESSRARNHSIFYKEKNSGDATFTYTIKATIAGYSSAFVGVSTGNYMIGVKILGDDYPLIDTPTTDCE